MVDGIAAGQETNTELTQSAPSVKDGGTVELTQGVPEWRQMGGGVDPQGRRRAELFLDRWSRFSAGAVDEQCSDAHGPEIVDGKPEH
jgi:hypothetical protein